MKDSVVGVSLRISLCFLDGLYGFFVQSFPGFRVWFFASLSLCGSLGLSRLSILAVVVIDVDVSTLSRLLLNPKPNPNPKPYDRFWVLRFSGLCTKKFLLTVSQQQRQYCWYMLVPLRIIFEAQATHHEGSPNINIEA